MRTLLSRSRDVAPFLFSERGVLQLSRSLKRLGGGASEFSDEKEQFHLELNSPVSQVELEAALLSDGLGRELVLRDSSFSKCTFRRWEFPKASLAQVTAPESSWEVVNLEGATIKESTFKEGRFQLVSFRDAELVDCDFAGATFTLCDFSGAKITSTSFEGAHFIGCSFEAALCCEAVNFQNADLSSADFRATWLGGADFTQARLQGSDFRGCLAAPKPESLIAAGARFRLARLGRLLVRILGDKPGAHRRVLLTQSALWAALAFALPVLFFARAINTPVDPDHLPFIEQEEHQEEQHHSEP